MEQLTSGRTTGEALAHFDPDLVHSALPRRPGWKPCFGQTSSSQSHLQSCGVGIGDVFLFFGWFRRVTCEGGDIWRYVRGAPDLHVVFGWLQIGEIIRVDEVGPARILRERPWLEDHPHLYFGPDPQNVIYVASDRLALPGIRDTGLHGASEIRQFRTNLVLTAPDAGRRGLWRLPPWFSPQTDAASLTYHKNQNRWRPVGHEIYLSSVGRGQEFVLDCSLRPQAAAWVARTLSGCARLRGAA